MGRNNQWILGGSVLAVALSCYLAMPGEKPIFNEAGIKLGLDLQGGAELLFSPKWESVDDLVLREKLQRDPNTLSRIAEITRKRIDVFGLKEIEVRQTESGRIRVALPGQDQAEAERIKNLIVNAGRLEFRLVAEKDIAAKWTESEAPRGYKWFPHRERGGEEITHSLLHVEDKYNVTGEDLSDAQVGTGKFGGYQVNFQIRRQSQRKFGDLTGDNIGRAMAIVLDGQIVSAPVIRGKISDNGMIEGGGNAGFSRDDATDLVTVLKTGSLPVALKADSQNVVGPGLGRDAIEAGKVAGIVGTLAVVLVMCVYYLGMGVLTTVGLAVALALVVGTLAAFNATLTLSGIAGLVLTLGMAVDANVLIYERIREEKRRGLGALEAVTEGFDRATETILDANITTLLTAVILYLVGEGPVQGFAITLSAGIVASVAASLLTTRALFIWLAERGVLRELKMLDLVGQPKVRYTRAIGPCLAISGLCIAGGLALLVSRGATNFGLDFRSGTLVQFTLREPTPIAEVRGTLASAEIDMPNGGGKYHPYANAEVVAIYRSWADATADANEFQLRTDLQQADEKGEDIAQVIRKDVARLFADRLAAGGFHPVETVPEGMSWSQTYRLHAEAPFEDVKAAVSKAVQSVFGEAFTFTVDRPSGQDKAERVQEVVVSIPRRALAEGETRDTVKARLRDELAPKVHYYLDDEALAPLPVAELVEDGDVTQTVTYRLPVSFRAPVTVAALRAVLDAANYRESEVSIEVAPANTIAATGTGPDEGEHVRGATFVMTGRTPGDGAADLLQRQLHDGFQKAGILLSDPFPLLTNILPQVAKELRQKGALALAMSLIVIVVYVALRFRGGAAGTATDAGGLVTLLRDMVYKARYGLAAVAALLHDVLFSIGAVAAADHFGLVDAKIDLPMLAAFLAIIGYSLNDTIIVFDRIRENLRRSAGTPVRELIDLSVNQTMSRTVLTSGTTLLAILALLVFGADATRGFAFTMLVGVGVGTYSSIFIASPLLLLG